MWYFVCLFIGMLGGFIATYLALEPKRLALNEQKREQEDRNRRLDEIAGDLAKSRKAIDSAVEQARVEKAEFDARVVSYAELQGENLLLKRDLFNLNMNVRKQHLDVEQTRRFQLELDERSQELAARFLSDNLKWISDCLTANNFANCKQRLQRVIDWCREINFNIPANRERDLHSELKKEFEMAVRAAMEREEQARIRAQIREEQKREREIEQELQKLDNDRSAIQAALSKAMAQANNQYNEEIERLKTRLAEAEARTARVKSQAQLTRSGHIYIIQYRIIRPGRFQNRHDAPFGTAGSNPRIGRRIRAVPFRHSHGDRM